MMHPSAHVAAQGEKAAVVVTGSDSGTLTYRQLDEASNRMAQLYRSRGIGPDDHIAVLLTNRVEWYPVVWGALRAGLYVTPVNSHLTAAEAASIIADCGARVLVSDLAMAADLDVDVEVRLRVGHVDLPGFEDLDGALAVQPPTPVDDQSEGSWMLYSSGTTGRPKGIRAPRPDLPLGAPTPFASLLVGLYGFGADTVYLSPAPLYHAAPAGWTTMTQRLGGTAIVMERFDPMEALALIERHRVTHVQFVPTHLVRLMKLPAAARARHDLSSLEMVVHAAAPCPVEVKRAAIDWLGPIVHEFYSGSEGVGFCAIGPDEWLAHPGSVGRSLLGDIHIVGSGGEEVAPGHDGQVWFESANRFEYHDDPEKTAGSWDDRGWATLGDIGHLDAEGYLYLTGRVGHTIITGGVNVYPRELEDLLIGHPAVADVAVVGRPDPDMGERVVAFVRLADEASEAELRDWCRQRLAHIKCPSQVRFLDDLPRLPTGKLATRFLPE